jgi:hypothetical protein
MDGFLCVARTIIGRRITAKARAEWAAKRDPPANAPPDWATGTFHSLVPDGLKLYRIGVPAGMAQLIADDMTLSLMSLLGDKLRPVAQDRFRYGIPIAEIATKRKIPLRTVERMIEDIRLIWQDAARRFEL